MELIINSLVIIFTALVILIVEKFMYRVQPSQQRISDYQKKLDEMDANAKKEYNLDWKHDATDEIMKERKLTKCFTLIFSGAFLVFILMGLIFLVPSFREVSIICISGIVLICYGFIKLAESKKAIVIVLAFVFIVGIGLDYIIRLSPYSFFYLCGFIAIVGILTMIPGSKKFVMKHGI